MHRELGEARLHIWSAVSHSYKLFLLAVEASTIRGRDNFMGLNYVQIARSG